MRRPPFVLRGLVLFGLTTAPAVLAGSINATAALSRQGSRDELSALAAANKTLAVAIVAPAANASVTGTVVIQATASGSPPVAGVQFQLDGAPLGAEITKLPYSYSWNTGATAGGTHTLTAVARDKTGNRVVSAPVTVNVAAADRTAPTVSIISPANGATVSGTVTIIASASDNVGVKSVQFKVDGSAIGTATGAPYSAVWNASAAAPGSHTLAAVASDAAGNSASASVSVVIPAQAPGAPVLVSPANGATGVAAPVNLTWNGVSGATSYAVYFGQSSPPPLAATTTATSYTAASLAAGAKYYWSVAAKNDGGTTASAIYSFTAGGSGGSGGSVLSYNSPYCGPSGGSTPWACGAWPSTTPPTLGPAGSKTTDPDTGNRVLRVTQSGSFGENASTAFKVFDAGWKRAWNADSTKFFAFSWSTSASLIKHYINWVGFDPATMSLTGASAAVPYQFADVQWDESDPDLVVGVVNGVAKTYNVVTGVWTTVFDPNSVQWGGTPWIAEWNGGRVCFAAGPQDTGYRLACYDRRSGATQVIDLHAQTINGRNFPVYFQGNPVILPAGVGVHTITLAPDGKWLAIDTHGNSLCSVPGLTNYASTSLFVNLETQVGYEWNVGCGSTHWAYGFDSVMAQSASTRWTRTGADGACSSDGRGVLRRNTDAEADSSIVQTVPCKSFSPATWSIGVHLSWLNNLNDENANNYPVLLATTNSGVANSFLWSDIAAIEIGAQAYQGRLWRFAQTWNDQISTQCSFLGYSSPSISRDGKWALFPSNWRGQTGSNGICANGKRTDLFLFELK